VEGVVALDHHRGARQRSVHVAEVELHVFGYVAAPLALVDARLFAFERFCWIEERVQHLVLDVDELHGGDGRVLVHRCNGGHLVTDEPHPVHRQSRLVRRPGDHAVARGEVPPGDHRVHAVQRLGEGGVDGDDPRVCVGAAQCAAVQHSR